MMAPQAAHLGRLGADCIYTRVLGFPCHFHSLAPSPPPDSPAAPFALTLPILTPLPHRAPSTASVAPSPNVPPQHLTRLSLSLSGSSLVVVVCTQAVARARWHGVMEVGHSRLGSGGRSLALCCGVEVVPHLPLFLTSSPHCSLFSHRRAAPVPLLLSLYGSTAAQIRRGRVLWRQIW
jgi:hypothetical protein